MKASNITLSVSLTLTSALVVGALGCARATKPYEHLDGVHRPDPIPPNSLVRPDNPVLPEETLPNPPPAAPEPPEAPLPVRGALVNLRVSGSLTFTEGRSENNAQIVAQVNDSRVETRLTAHVLENGRVTPAGLPDGMTLRRTSEGWFAVDWTPALGFVTGVENTRRIPIRLRLEITNREALPADLRAELDQLESRMQHDTEIQVNRSQQMPRIVSVVADLASGFQAPADRNLMQILEGASDRARVFVTIEDPTLPRTGDIALGQYPQLLIGSSATERLSLFVTDGAALVRGWSPQLTPVSSGIRSYRELPLHGTDGVTVQESRERGSQGERRFVYTILMDVKNRPVPAAQLVGAGRQGVDNAAPAVLVRFHVGARSRRSQVFAPNEEAVFRIQYVDDRHKLRLAGEEVFAFNRGAGRQERTVLFTTDAKQGTVHAVRVAPNVRRRSESAQENRTNNNLSLTCAGPSSTFSGRDNVECRLIYTGDCGTQEGQRSVTVPAVVHVVSDRDNGTREVPTQISIPVRFETPGSNCRAGGSL